MSAISIGLSPIRIARALPAWSVLLGQPYLGQPVDVEQSVDQLVDQGGSLTAAIWSAPLPHTHRGREAGAGGRGSGCGAVRAGERCIASFRRNSGMSDTMNGLENT